ncbi:MAG: C-terminal binding protein [Spirochaetia bacterium]|jgi:D-3-phosphoglycerate dehydrogenase
MSTYHVVVTDDRFGSYREEEAILSRIGASLEVRNLASEEEAITAFRNTDGILVNLFPMGRRVIESLSQCRVISRYGVGYDNVDVEAATRMGIWVARVPDYAYEDVSDQALALLMACVRKVAYKDRKVRQGKWNLHKDFPTFRIAGKTLGLVGYGAIARCFHHKVSGLGLAQVLICDPYIDPSVLVKTGARPVDLATLVCESDFISVHVPLAAETRGLIGAREMGMMKPTAILINTARGPVIDESALIAALSDRRIAAAGLDVFEKEPIPADSPLIAMDTVTLSDHAGWYTDESVKELKTKAAQNVAAALAKGRPVSPVNAV